MNVAEAMQLINDVLENAEQLKEDLARDCPRREVFQELYSLRRSVQRLELQVRDPEVDTLGDAC